MKTLHNNYCNSKQGYLPLFLSDCLDLLDPVLTFDRLMGGIDLKKYMKFPMFKKETKDEKYHEDPFRAVNFRIDEQGVMRCPNDRAFHFLYRKNVRGNQYGRKEELYECEDCSGCPYAEKCKKTDKNRTVRYKQKALSEL